MTDRAEIERLLNQTGRTLEGLPEDYGDKKLELWNSFRDKTFGHIKSFDMANRILHQSDVIELLVGALRDALDKPMQKPMSREEFDAIYSAREDHVWPFYSEPPMLFLESSIEKLDFCWISWSDAADLLMNRFRKYSADSYGKNWRVWRYKPTDEEREAAAWES